MLRTPLPTLALLLLAILSPAAGQVPDPGPYLGPLDEALGEIIPPALNLTYGALGQNITREDVRIYADLNFTKGDFDLFGLFIGSGNAEIQATLDARLEMRVISSDRIRAALEGENAYNMSAENATFLSQAYLPAEVFRATLSGEAIAAFQRDQESRLGDYLSSTMPELKVLALKIGWENAEPQKSIEDTSLTEPPIIVHLDLVVQYLRVESVPSLLSHYFDTGADAERRESRKEYIKELKEDNGDPLRSRDFFAAAAYTQLLNLSMQPGWSLDMSLSVPRGYAFTYANENVEHHGPRRISLHVDALSSDDAERQVILTSITQKRAVALVLFGAMWLVGVVAAFPLRFLYVRKRLAKMAKV